MNAKLKLADRSGFVSHRGFVNTWECDENSHWNVQFYNRAFEQAGEYLATALRLAAGEPPALVDRHVRYHRELRAGEPYVIRSGRMQPEGGEDRIVHLLTHAESGELHASAMDRLKADISDIPPIADPLSEQALPRGINMRELTPANTSDLVHSGRALDSHMSIVRPEELDSRGRLLASRIVARFSDAAAHLWQHAGIGAQWLQEHHRGRVAVEMKLTLPDPVKEGEALKIVSWICNPAGRTFGIRHQVESISHPRVVALSEIRCLLLDLASRKAVQLPEFLRTKTE